MKPLRQRSLQSRLLLLVLGFASVLWLGAAVFTWRDAQHEIDELLDGHLAQTAALMMVQATGEHDDVTDVPVLHKDARRVAFQVFVEGALITRSANVGPQAMSARRDGFDTVRLPALGEEGDFDQWRVAIVHNDDHDITVLLAEEVDSRQSILWAVMGSLFTPLLLVLPLLVMGLWWSVRQGLSPLHDLRSALDQRAPNATEPVSLEGLPRELQPLVQTLNALLERIHHMVQNERRFTADAAHELRTPIAAIRMQAQVALGAGDDAAQRTHALQTTLAGCDRASRLVDQLLTLARLEAAPTAPPVAVDLAAVVRRIASELAHTALAHQQELVVLAEAPCAVAANEVLLGVLVRNLVDNALRYSPAGASIQVTVTAEAGAVTLCVEDSGAGMTDDAIARLGERFFRVLGSEQPGSGLGWSIVRRLLAVFGAQAQVGRSASLGGLSVTVRWPAPQAGS
jgi:two-component system sensor histidine kinase QseC